MLRYVKHTQKIKTTKKIRGLGQGSAVHLYKIQFYFSLKNQNNRNIFFPRTWARLRCTPIQNTILIFSKNQNNKNAFLPRTWARLRGTPLQNTILIFSKNQNNQNAFFAQQFRIRVRGFLYV